MKPSLYYRKKEQTYVKHYFLERYLETVAFHIGYSYQDFVYVDGFSGPWRATDEQLADTSIRIALDKLNYVRDGLAAQGKCANIRAIFVEKDSTSFTALSQALRSHSHAINATALPGTFEENIPKILELVGNTFAFFFIDPRGWTGFAMENISAILRHQPGEVMVNFMYDFINRFINYPREGNEKSLDKFFGTADWRDIRDAADRETASVTKYAEQLRTVGACPYTTYTRILKPLSDRAYFHLVYATRSPKGIRKFRDVEQQTVREQDAVRKKAQREHREQRTGQKELAFAPARELSESILAERALRLQEAETRLFTILKQGSRPYAHIQPRVLEIPLVWQSDLNSMLGRLCKSGRITMLLAPRQRTPKPNTIIGLPDQNT